MRRSCTALLWTVCICRAHLDLSIGVRLLTRPIDRGQQSRSRAAATVRHTTHHIFDEIEHVVDHEKDALRKAIMKERAWLEHAENKLEAWLKDTRLLWFLAARGLIGTLTLSTVTGWPIFRKAFREVSDTYQRTRDAVKHEMSHIKKPRELLRAVTYELDSLQRITREAQDEAQDSKISRMEAKHVLEQAEVDIKRLKHEAWLLNQACDSISALTAAVDFVKLQDVGKSVYTGALACIASANSVTVQKLSLAFDLGAILGDNISCLITSLCETVHTKEISAVIPAETQRFIGLSVQAAGTIKGLIIVNTLLPRMSLRLSSSALGAAWVTEAVAGILDPWLEEHHQTPLGGHYGSVILHTGLTVLGYYSQKTHPGRLPVLIQRALTPLTIAEGRLKDLSSLFNTWGKHS